MPYYREPPFARYLDHLFVFMVYALLATAGWIIYGQAVDGVRAEYLQYSIILTITAGIAALSALFDHYRWEFSVIPIIITHNLIYAIALLAEPNELHGAIIMVSFAFVSARRFLHLWVVSNKLRKAKQVENGRGRNC